MTVKTRVTGSNNLKPTGAQGSGKAAADAVVFWVTQPRKQDWIPHRDGQMMVVLGHHHTDLLSQLWSLPVMGSTAVVFSSPHTHEYSPASNMVREWSCSSHMAPFCCSLYLSLSPRVTVPFFHSTEAFLPS